MNTTTFSMRQQASRVNSEELIINTGTLIMLHTLSRVYQLIYLDISEGYTTGTSSETFPLPKHTETMTRLLLESSLDSQSSDSGKLTGVKATTFPQDSIFSKNQTLPLDTSSTIPSFMITVTS